jgi:hypothetical protein
MTDHLVDLREPRSLRALIGPPAASVVMVTSQDDSGKAICAWNLQRDDRARDLAFPNTTESYTARLQSSG